MCWEKGLRLFYKEKKSLIIHFEVGIPNHRVWIRVRVRVGLRVRLRVEVRVGIGVVLLYIKIQKAKYFVIFESELWKGSQMKSEPPPPPPPSPLLPQTKDAQVYDFFSKYVDTKHGLYEKENGVQQKKTVSICSI